MEQQTKTLLKNSLKQYREAEGHEKYKMVSLVKKRIKQHNNALKTIGTGYADHFVKAGKVFLRIVEKQSDD